MGCKVGAEKGVYHPAARKAPDITPSRTYIKLEFDLMSPIDQAEVAYVKLRVTTRSLVEASLLQLGAVETAGGGTENRLASKGPAGGHSSN